MKIINNSTDFLQASHEAFASKAMQEYIGKYSEAYVEACKALAIAAPTDLAQDAEKHGEFWQAFWEFLPDTPSIRTGAFSTVCDLAEWFCFGDR